MQYQVIVGTVDGTPGAEDGEVTVFVTGDLTKAKNRAKSIAQGAGDVVSFPGSADPNDLVFLPIEQVQYARVRAIE